MYKKILVDIIKFSSKNQESVVLLIITSGISLIHFLFLWMYTNIDGYFYWAIGEYFRTGIYPFISPFIYLRPTTISPPLYGLLLMVLGYVQRSDILLHGMQLAMQIGTTMLLFSILSTLVSRRASLILSFIHFIFPINIIFVSSMMTEIPAQFLVTLYLYFLSRPIRSDRTNSLSFAVIISAILTLLKYQFLLLLGASLFYITYLLIKKHIKSFRIFLSATASVALILLWIFINHEVTGVWGLSDTKKLPFYTNFVWNGHYFPRENNPAVIALRKYVPPPPKADKYAEYWDLQDYILPFVQKDWKVIDELLGNVGIAAIKEQPISYVFNAGKTFFDIHIHQSPIWHNVSSFGTVDPEQPLYCDRLRTLQFCQPLIMTKQSYQLWNMFARLTEHLYNTIFRFLFSFLFLPLLAFSLTAKIPRKQKLFSLLYIFFLAPLSFLAFAESRYLVPFYPLMVIVSVIGTKSLWENIRRLSWRR